MAKKRPINGQNWPKMTISNPEIPIVFKSRDWFSGLQALSITENLKSTSRSKGSKLIKVWNVKQMFRFKLGLSLIFQKQLRPPLMPMEITYKNAIYLKGFFVTFIAKSCHAL